MGRRAARKNKASKSPPSDLLKPEVPTSHASSSKEFNLVPDMSIRDDVEDHLIRIYDSFFQEFRKRLSERKEADDPLSVSPLQRSALDDNVRTHLIARVHSLSRTISLNEVYELFQDRTFDFIERLLVTVRDLVGDRLRAGLLLDAFDVMENAVEVVEGLIRGSQYGPDLILHLSKTEFYSLIKSDQSLQSLFQWGSSLSASHPLYMDQARYSQEYLEEEEISDRRGVHEMTQSMSLEELVLYINEPGKGKKSREKEEKTEAEREEDRAVEEFRHKLEAASRLHKKPVQPRFTDEWLQRMALRLCPIA